MKCVTPACISVTGRSRTLSILPVSTCVGLGVDEKGLNKGTGVSQLHLVEAKKY